MTTQTPTARRVRASAATRLPGDRAIVASPSTWVVWFAVAAFFILLFGILFSVLTDSFAREWFSGWLPAGYITDWYSSAWEEFNLGHVIAVTVFVALTTVVVSVLLGGPAAYQLARRNFPGKKLLMVLFLLPVLMPPLTYGIPLATVMYNLGFGRTLLGVVLVNLVPAVPFVILTMTPFIEQINPNIESAARMSGANTLAVFTRILAPLLIPGLLAASVLVLVRTVGLFELTFLVSGPESDTLVVTLYRAMTAAGGTVSRQLVSSMSVVYAGTMMIILILALRFVNPTQLVARVDSDKKAT
jgi:putative spermidine/putrescine transport system permease protein